MKFSINRQIGNIMSALSWFAATAFVNLLALNRLLAFDIYTTLNQAAAAKTSMITTVS
jgi:hypothetical protein